MSTYTDASLIVTPNSYKEGKLYSIIPTDGSGDLSVVRATTATRVNSDGLIELVPYNLLNYSEQFDNAFWVKSGTTIIANDTISPDGNTTADRVTRDASGNGTIEKSFSTTNSTFSVFAKKGNSNLISLFALGSSHRADFNLDLGTIISSSGTGVSPKIENYGNGWFRCILENVPSVTQVRIYAGGVGTAVENDYNYIWGAQLVQGSEAKEYLRTETGLNIPRLDYSNGCPSILVEPQRTNLFSYSEQFDNAYWSKSGTTIIADDTISPDGNTTADALLGSGANSGHYLLKSISFTLGTTYTISIFAKKGTNNFIQLGGQNSVFGLQAYANFDLENGVLGTVAAGTSASIIGFSDNWYKCSITINSLATNSGSIYFSLINSSTSIKLESNTLDKTVYIWGAQLEAGSNATSYIPTVASAVTRNADVISKTGIADLINSEEGCLFVECSVLSEAITNSLTFSIGDGTNNNYMYFRVTPNTKALAVLAAVGGVLQVVMTNTTTFNLSNTFKVAIKWKLNDYSLWFNGVKIASDNIASVWSAGVINKFSFNAGYSNINTFEGKVKQVNIYKTALTDTELAQLTTI